MTSISHESCAPYLSSLLLDASVNPAPSAEKLRRALVKEAESFANQRPIIERKAVRPLAGPITHKDAEIAWFNYREKREAAWCSSGDLVDQLNHAVFAMMKEGVYALTFTDPAFRNAVAASIRKAKTGVLSQVRLLPPIDLRNAFVGNGVRTLWLSGTHRRSTVKADAKVLSGLELESALDPLEDQSYYYSSVRSQVLLASSEDTGRAIVGASPRSARVWQGPTKNWEDFASRSKAIIDAALTAKAQTEATASVLSILAQPLDVVPNASRPYDMAVFVPEQAPTGDANDEDAWLHEFSDAARFEIQGISDEVLAAELANTPSFEAKVFWGDVEIGHLRYAFTGSSADDLAIEELTWNDDDPNATSIRRFCRNRDLLTIYYDTGHTFARGQFYLTQFRDVPFHDWAWVRLDEFRLDAEKPLNDRKLDIAGIGAGTDTSLFGLVARHWPNIADRGAQTGWLACDDGAMESADFVHFDDTSTPPALTLIHVKGSGSPESDRGISVSDYEIVVGQAVKNLRYLDRVNIGAKLKRNKGNLIGNAVWHDGVRQANRDQLIQILELAGSNMTKKVVVLQPRVRKSEHDQVRDLASQGSNVDRVQRLKQLDTLLLSARAECLGLGADFVVLAHDDELP